MKYILILIYVMASGAVDTRTYPGAFKSQDACTVAAQMVGYGALASPPIEGELRGYMCFPIEPVETGLGSDAVAE